MADDKKPVEPADSTPPKEASEVTPAAFTQADMDRVVQERLARERAKYADYDDLKGAAAKWQEYVDAQKTEFEKARDALAEEQRTRTALEEQMQDLRRKTAVLSAAGKHGIPADRLEDAYKLLDLTAIGIAEDGSMAGVDDALKALVEAKPYLVELGRAQPATTQTRTASPAEPAGGRQSHRDDIMKSLYGPSWESVGESGIWGTDYHESMGGGVFIPTTAQLEDEESE